MNNNFSKNLKYLRESKGMSKSDLAKRMKISQSTISRWENNEMGITIGNAYDLANVLNISIADLIGKDLTSEKDFNELNEYDVLFNKYKELTPEDKELIKNIIEMRKKQIDKDLDENP